jgi:4-hydroxythreonine-4-phosphate dehydrogenase
VRTSPDHGTAYDIAGSGTANGASMLAAMEYAWRAVNGIAREGRDDAEVTNRPRKARRERPDEESLTATADRN